MTSLLRTIIANEISLARQCHKILESDGVTTSDFVISSMQRIFEGVSINLKSVRTIVPAIGDSAGIAKNLDEYQFMICSMVSSIPDSDPNKKRLQKYRVAILASFAKLVPILTSPDNEQLAKWNSNARSLLVETSEAVTIMKSATGSKNDARYSNGRLAETFAFFDVPENELDKELDALY